MKTESTIGKLQPEATEIHGYHRQSSVGNISESLQEREADTTRVRQSRKDHVSTVSDDQGELLEHYGYTAFGEPEVYSLESQSKLAGAAIANPVLWNSRRYDEQTDLYYYKYRHYKADIGRWLGRDPIEERGGINLCVIALNNLLNLYDLLGLEVEASEVKEDKENQDKLTARETQGGRKIYAKTEPNWEIPAQEVVGDTNVTLK